MFHKRAFRLEVQKIIEVSIRLELLKMLLFLWIHVGRLLYGFLFDVKIIFQRCIIDRVFNFIEKRIWVEFTGFCILFKDIKLFFPQNTLFRIKAISKKLLPKLILKTELPRYDFIVTRVREEKNYHFVKTHKFWTLLSKNMLKNTSK